MARRKLPSSIHLERHWRRYVFPLIVLLVASVLSLCDRARQPEVPASDYAVYHDRSFPVLRVVDGDTLVLDAPDSVRGKESTSVRLWGVDTPEIARDGKSGMYYGAEAAAFAAKALGNRTVHVVLTPDDTRDRYDRLLAYIHLERGGAMLNEMLLEEGYAYADGRFDHPFKRSFGELEKRAISAKVGLWAGVTREQMPEWRQRTHTPGSRGD